MTPRIAIIGAGPGGYVAAIRAAQLGAEVFLVEREAVGGVCLNWGCIPSKVFKAAAEILAGWRRGERFGLSLAEPAGVDMGRLVARKNGVVADQVKGIEHLLARQGVDLIRGRAAISAPGELRVVTEAGQERIVSWDRLILATGSRPAALPNMPFDEAGILCSDDVFRLKRVPESLVIVGGGAIGCEFASILTALGSRVILVEALDRLLPQPWVDPDCSRTLAREMKKQGIEVLLRHTVESAVASGGSLRITMAPSSSQKETAPPDDAGSQKVRTEVCQQMLVCIGRRANVDGLGLESVGLAPDGDGWLQTDEHMATERPGIFAIGDALGPAKVMLAHVASAEGMVAAENAVGQASVMRYDAVPNAVFTIPEVANVGMTEQQAADRGVAARAAIVLYRSIGKAHALGELAGTAKIVWEEGTGRVLGLHLVGAGATDLVAEGTLALRTGRRVTDLAETIHAHPTLSEVVMEAALKADGRPRHG
jgi:dihydrolipoamide dehydrogenase